MERQQQAAEGAEEEVPACGGPELLPVPEQHGGRSSSTAQPSRQVAVTREGRRTSGQK
ncbi:MAG: hypothetical protein ACLSAF_13100 [Intestinimonas sp.]